MAEANNKTLLIAETQDRSRQGDWGGKTVRSGRRGTGRTYNVKESFSKRSTSDGRPVAGPQHSASAGT